MGSDEIVVPAAPRATRVRYQVLVAVCGMAVIAYIHRLAFALVGTEVKRDFHLGDDQFSYLTAAFLWSYAIFEVPSGLLSDKFGVRHFLTLVVFGWSVMTGSVFLAGGFAGLWTLRFVFGMFQAGAFPALSRMMADWMPVSERGTAQGLIWMASRSGGAIAPFIVVPLIEKVGSWQSAFMILSLLGVAWCALFWPWFRNKPEEKSGVNATELAIIAAGRAPRASGRGHLPWSRLFRSRSVVALCLMYGFGGFSASFFITLLPTYLRDQRHLTPDQTKWLTSLPLAAGIVACLLGGMLSDLIIRRTGSRKWGRRLNGLVGHACAGVTLLSINWVEDIRLLSLLLCLTFFFNDLAMGPAWAACADIGGVFAGTVGGTMNMIGNLFAATGNVVVGNLLGRVFSISVSGANGEVIREWLFQGNELVFIVFGCSFWLASLCWLGVDATKTLKEEPA